MTTENDRRPGLPSGAGPSIPRRSPRAPGTQVRAKPLQQPSRPAGSDDWHHRGRRRSRRARRPGKARIWRKRLLIAATIPALAYGGTAAVAPDRDGPRHRLHGRRLRQRARDLPRRPGARPGQPGPGRRQHAGRPRRRARPARPRAQPGPGRDQEVGGHRRGGGPDGRRVAGPGHAGDAAEPSMEAPAGDRERRQPGRPAAGQGRDVEEPGGHRQPRRADFVRAEHLIARGAIATEEFDQRKEADRVAEAMANQALEEVYESRVSLGLPPRPEKGELTDVPHDLNQNYSGVRQALAELIQATTAVGLPLTSVADTPTRTLDEFASRDREREHRPRPREADPGGAGGQAGPGRAPPGAERPRPGRAQPPVLRGQGRDRRRGHPSQRQPRQQRRRGAGAHGGPVGHGDLDRRQLQGDPARPAADRTARALRGRHVRGQPRVRGPYHRLHHGDRPDAGPAAPAECHRELRQDRPAAAGPHRADRLRSGHAAPLRGPVGRALRLLQGEARGPARRGVPAIAGHGPAGCRSGTAGGPRP